MAKVVVFAQTFETDNTCIIGSPTERVYADQMDKSTLSNDDSFLELYRWNLALKYPMYFIEHQFNTDIFSHYRIGKNRVLCAMKRIPNVSQTMKVCSSSNETGKFKTQLPCITNQMVDYIDWGLNETFGCFADQIDEYEMKMIFKKINHESAFGFFFQYQGGTGLTQLIHGTQKDMFTPGYSGNTFLTNYVNNHPKECMSFIKLLRRSMKNKEIKSCQLMSIGDGVGRSLLGGVGLYLHYRSDANNPYSAERLLQYWGYPKSNSKYYRQIRSYITLGMYNKGPGAVIYDIKSKIGKNVLAKKNDQRAYAIVMNAIQNSSFYGYVRAVELSTSKIFNRDGSCKL